MSFPLTVADRVFETPPALAAAVRADAEAGGGTIVRGRSPATWVPALPLPRAYLVALAADLLRTPHPAVLAEGSRIAVALGEGELGELAALAAGQTDMGVLLARDPLWREQSVEDALLRAWATLAPHTERDELLQRLRNAGLADVEVSVLARHGSADDIAEWLPPLLREGLPNGASGSVLAGLHRPEVREALVRAIRPLPPSEKAPLWVALQRDRELSKDKALQAALFGR